MQWLSGRWEGTQAGVHSVERWFNPSGGIMLGMHHDRREDGQTFTEALRIEQRADQCVLIAKPEGSPETEFVASIFREGEWLFENQSHDWPKAIRYTLNEERKLNWRWRRSAPLNQSISSNRETTESR